MVLYWACGAGLLAVGCWRWAFGVGGLRLAFLHVACLRLAFLRWALLRWVLFGFLALGFCLCFFGLGRFGVGLLALCFWRWVALGFWR